MRRQLSMKLHVPSIASLFGRWCWQGVNFKGFRYVLYNKYLAGVSERIAIARTKKSQADCCPSWRPGFGTAKRFAVSGRQ